MDFLDEKTFYTLVVMKTNSEIKMVNWKKVKLISKLLSQQKWKHKQGNEFSSNEIENIEYLTHYQITNF